VIPFSVFSVTEQRDPPEIARALTERKYTTPFRPRCHPQPFTAPADRARFISLASRPPPRFACTARATKFCKTGLSTPDHEPGQEEFRMFFICPANTIPAPTTGPPIEPAYLSNRNSKIETQKSKSPVSTKVSWRAALPSSAVHGFRAPHATFSARCLIVALAQPIACQYDTPDSHCLNKPPPSTIQHPASPSRQIFTLTFLTI
jgi:hypothetical protein